MLTSDNKGIQKFILDRITQINDEIVNHDPEYQEILEEVGEEKSVKRKEKREKVRPNSRWISVFTCFILLFTLYPLSF